MNINFSIFCDGRPIQQSIHWLELRAMLEIPREQEEEIISFNGAKFCPTYMVRNDKVRSEIHRIKECVSEVTLLILEYNRAKDMRAALAEWQDFEHLAYTTFQHGTAEKPCDFIVVIPLACAIQTADYPALWQWAFERSGGLIDKAGKNPSRSVYMPRCSCERPSLFRFVANRAPYLDWRKLGI